MFDTRRLDASPTALLATAPTTKLVAPSPRPIQQEQDVLLPASTATPAHYFDDQRLTCEPDFYVPQVQAWLDAQPGLLKGMIFAVGDRCHTFGEALISQTSYYSRNPKVVLALLELQSGLILNPQLSKE